MTEALLKGTIDIHPNDKALEATLVFTPDESGEEWDTDKVLPLLAQKGIIYGFTPSSVTHGLKELAGGQESRIIIARGDAPELPVVEEYGWKELHIPEELKETAEKLLKTDTAPVITVAASEKVVQDKVVKKKSKLPFLKAKEETVSVIETVENSQRVYLDPTVVATGYVQEGEQIAAIYPSKAGKPGKSIYAEPITSQEDAEPPLYLGKNVEKGKGELVSSITGFLRRGKNWVEVISFEDHDWQMEFSNDNATCFLSFETGSKDVPVPNAEEVIQDAKDHGYPADALIPEKEIRALLVHAAKSGEPLSKRPICRDRDASIDLVINDSKTLASLTILKGRGHGKALVLKEVSSAIREAKLKGINTDKIKEDIVAFYRGTEHELRDYVLAEGTLPEVPGIAETDCIVTIPSNEEIEKLKILAMEAPSELFLGIESLQEFPLEEVEQIAPVLRHQPVAKIIPPKPRTPGMDVFGKPFETGEAENPPLKVFENLTVDQNTVVADIAGVLDISSKEEVLYLRVRPHRNGEAEITVTEDRMQALINLFPPEGTGVAVTFEEIRTLLKERGVIKGIDDYRIEDAVKRSASGEIFEGYVVAEGKEPQDAAPNKLEILSELASGSKVKIRNNGSADYRSQDTITNVKKGQVVARLYPPDEKPNDGWDIFGKEIRAKDITAYPVEIGKHLEQKKMEDGSVELVAAISGELLYDRKFIDVRNIHTVEGDVNLQVGNIKFAGGVEVKGTVESGFQIFAGEDIHIGESVEGALLSANHDIVIDRGVIGKNKGVIRAKGCVQAAFVENARLLAVKDITIKGYCLRSHLKCNGKVFLEGDKGFFMGGSVKSRSGMEVTDLGSEQELKTLVSFGQDYLVEDQIELEEREIQKIKDKLMKFESIMNSLEKQGNRPDLEKVRKEKLKFLKIVEKRSLRLFNLREKFEEYIPSEVTVRDSVYPGVIIESHGRTHEIMKKRTGVVYYFDKESGRINEKDIESSS